MQRIKILELFGGIGSPRMALENLGIPLKLIDYVEVLDFAVLAYNKMFQHEHIAQNVKEWNLHVDILIHGSPCQDFSLAGKNDLASGRSILYKRTLEIIEKELNPKPQVVIWENVPNLLSPKNLPHFQQYLDTLAKLGYKNEYRILNGKDFGIPQNRKRVFVVSIHKDSKFTFDFDNLQSKVLDKTLKNYLEPHDKVDEWYYLKEKHIAKSVERGMIRIVQNNVGTMVDGQTLWNNSHTTIPLTSYVRENIVLDSAAPVADCIIAQNPRWHKIAVPVKKIQFSKTGRTLLPMTTYIQENEVFSQDGIVGTIGATNSLARRKVAIPIKDLTNNYVPNVLVDAMDPIEGIPIFMIDGKPYHIRILTEKECWRLMGFSDTTIKKVFDCQPPIPRKELYKLAGNSIIVQVMEAIFSELLKPWRKN